MANKKWKYVIGKDGEAVEAVFKTEIIVDSLMMDGLRGKTLDGENAYLQIIGEFGSITHKAKFPPLLKNGTRIEIVVRVEKEE